MSHLNSIPRTKMFSKILMIFSILTILFLMSCRDNEPVVYVPGEPMTFDATSEWYDHPDAFHPNASPRTDAVGKWRDLDNNIIFEVKAVTKNTQGEYVYEISSKVSEFPAPEFMPLKEVALNKNNINIDNKYRFIVEGTRGWLWVMSDHPYKIRIKRDNWKW